MKLPFFQGSENEQQDSQESTAAVTLEPEVTESATEEQDAPEARVAPEEERHAMESEEPVVALEMPPMPTAIEQRNTDGMRSAFANVAAAMDGEVEALRRSLADLQTTLGRAVEGEKHARNHAMDGIKQSLTSRIDEVVASREKIVGELKLSVEQEHKRMDGRVEDVKQAAGRERERVDSRLDEVKAAIEQSVQTKVEKLSAEVDTLGQNLQALQLELQRQTEASQKVTAVLDNMAGVLSGNQAQPSPAPVVAAQPAVAPAQPVAAAAERVEPSGNAQSGDPAEVDDALERVFK